MNALSRLEAKRFVNQKRPVARASGGVVGGQATSFSAN
jgi:hypothetical protein